MGQKVKLGRDPGRMPKGDFLLFLPQIWPTMFGELGAKPPGRFCFLQESGQGFGAGCVCVCGGGRGKEKFSAVLEEGAHWGWGAKARWEVASEGTGGRKGEPGGREDAGSRTWNAG